jgi:hypothetical protein
MCSVSIRTDATAAQFLRGSADAHDVPTGACVSACLASPLALVRERPPRAWRAARTPRVPETHAVHLWTEIAVPGARLTLHDGRVCELRTTGRLNVGDGPDFLDAEIAIDGGTLAGAIEVHVDAADWRAHGHTGDPRYAAVVLHVVLFRPARPPAADEPPLLVLVDHLRTPFRQAWLRAIDATTARPPMLCAGIAHCIPRRTVDAMIVLACAERFERKLQRARMRLVALDQVAGVTVTAPPPDDADEPAWQLLYELFARGLGYGGNEEQLTELARSAPLQRLEGLSAADRTGLLLALGGLAAGTETGSTAETCAAADSAAAAPMPQPVLPLHSWSASGVMPANRAPYAVRRLAAAAGPLADAVSRAELIAALARVGDDPGGGFADLERRLRTCFESAPGPGLERLHELMINALAPWASIFGERHGHTPVHRAGVQLYTALRPAPHNAHTRALAAEFGLPQDCTALQQQGMIELRTAYCLESRCDRCLLGRTLMEK